MENIEQYQYQPLRTSTSIRLLWLRPGVGASEFSCGLREADISSPPEYLALSYAWGDQKVNILCDGKTVEVPLNLRVALERLLDTSIDRAIDYLWTDALCIDQKNTPEKNQQVKMMADIYKKATMVTVWLGLDEKGYAKLVFDDMYVLMECLAEVHNSGGTFRHVDEETGGLHWLHGDGRKCVSTLPPAFVHPGEEELARLKWFFCLPWFSRTWVLQEVGLASCAILMLGGLGSEWHPIGIIALFLMRHCRAIMERLGIAVEVNKVCHLFTAFSPFIPRATFFHVLDNARRFEAKDPRDKIFALLSHPTSRTISMSDVQLENVSSFEPYRSLVIHFLPDFGTQFVVRTLASRLPSPSEWQLQAPLFEADYGSPVEEVYRSFALDHIRRTSSLEILTAVQHNPTSISLTNSVYPTWVPRWDQFHDTPILGLYNSQHIASANKDAIFDSSSSSPFTLTVRGILLDTILYHTCVLQASDFDLPLPITTTPLTPDSEAVQRLWTSCPIARVWLSTDAATVDPNSYFQLGWPRYGGSVIAAYRSAWVADKNLSQVDKFNLDADFQAYWDRLFWGIQRARMTRNNRQQTPEGEDVGGSGDDEQFKGDEEDLEGENGSWQRYRDSAAYVCNKRKFFTTSIGFFGIGPGALLAGDIVAVLLGADVPFVLRRVPAEEGEAQNGEEGQKYALVGECSVRGVMGGQAMRAGLEHRDFVLI